MCGSFFSLYKPRCHEGESYGLVFFRTACIVVPCAQLVDQWLKRAETSSGHSYLTGATAHTVGITLPWARSFPPAPKQWHRWLQLLGKQDKSCRQNKFVVFIFIWKTPLKFWGTINQFQSDIDLPRRPERTLFSHEEEHRRCVVWTGHLYQHLRIVIPDKMLRP